jgi:[ribosomal protein S5]-alanine N-acetyltransferase
MSHIETERLLLKRMTEWDLESLASLFADPEVMHFSLRGPCSIEETKEVMEIILENERKYGLGACSVILKETGQWIGFCALWRGGDKIDFGYRFLKESWGRGYATEAIKPFLKYVSALFPEVEVYAYITPENKASLRIAEKVGMRFLKKDFYHDIPVLIYVCEG